MRKLLFFTLCVSVKITIQQDNEDHEMINYGASTSRQDQDSLTCENNDVENCASRVISLMIAQDVRSGNLTEPTGLELEELQAFHDEIFSYIILAQYGVSDLTNTFRQEERLDYFFYSLKEAVLEIIEKACNDHYFINSFYEFDRNRRTILLHEFIRSNSVAFQPCLCVNFQERMILNQPVTLPNFTFSDTAFQVNVDNDGRVFVSETSQFHIIPVPLLKAFFKKWLEDSPNVHDNTTNCVNTLYGRLKRSIQKVVIFKLKNTKRVTVDTWQRAGASSQSFEYFMTELFSDSDGWMGGNIYLGPQNTGPGVDLTEQDSINFFDDDVELIIGTDRFSELQTLYEDLHYFLNLDVETDVMSWTEHLLSGFVLFIRISNAIARHGITPMDLRHWDLFPPTQDQLRRAATEEMRIVLRNQKFWGIKQSEHRNPRSSDCLTDEKTKKKSGKFSSRGLRYQWNKFVADLMTISTQARFKNEPLDWLCDFTILYNDYLFNQTATTNVTECVSSGFGQYLYRKFSRSREWSKCNKGMKVSGDWCSAWRRTVFLDIRLKYTNAKKEKKIYDSNFVKDVGAIVRWLSSKVQAKRCDQSKQLPPTFRENVFQSHKKINNNLDDEADLLAIKSYFMQHNSTDLFGYVQDSE